MKKQLICIILLGLSACSIIYGPSESRKAIQTGLYEGMSKADMLKRLGDPYKIDHLSTDEEIAYYETDGLAGTFCLQYTAIRLLDGKVHEWGNQVCKEPDDNTDPEAGKLDSSLKQ
ncbi:MAG: hypothetical protein Q7U57_13350 [Methylovulum sp.]|nr:hypothetical protein [Methylovulum sp.]